MAKKYAAELGKTGWNLEQKEGYSERKKSLSDISAWLHGKGI